MSTKILVAVIVIVAAVAVGAAAYLLMQEPPETYELSYNFQPGESYVYDITIGMEVMGASMEMSSRDKWDVLQVMDNEFHIRDSATVQITIAGQEAQEAAVVMTYRMTNKGARSGMEMEEVEPAELWSAMEENLGQWENLYTGVYNYPTGPVTVGRQWSIPLDFQYEQAGLPVTLAGEFTSSITGRESVTVAAGTFDCWLLAHNMSVSGETEIEGQTVTMTMSGEGTAWVDVRSGAQTKVNLPLSIKAEAGGMTIEFSMSLAMELTEYQAP